MMAAADSIMRIFFALWPDPQLRAQIAATRAQLLPLNPPQASEDATADASRRQRPWRQVPDHNLHLTLLFLGNQPARAVHQLKARVKALRTQRFELLLDRFGWFARPRVLWLGADPPAAGIDLVQALCRISSACGMTYQQREWRPHMSLYRHVSGPPELPQIPVLHWAPREFVLLQSLPSQPYRVLQSWAI